jgi:hypothetical protein
MSIFKFYPVQILITILIVEMCAISACKLNSDVDAVTPVPIKVDESYFDAIGDRAMASDSNILRMMYRDTALSDILSGSILVGGDSTNRLNLFRAYFNDSNRIRLKDTIDKVFHPVHWINALGSPVARYLASFPGRDTPSVYTMISDFNYSIFLFRDDHRHDAIGVGKEMFLGDPAYYDPLSTANPNFSTYLNRTFNTDHLVSKIMVALATDVIRAPSSNRLLDHILYEGKKLYFVKKWMPGIQDTLLHEYSREQWDWVQKNELDIWRFLLADKLLYKTSGRDVANLVDPAPHSQGMPPEAPGRAVNYIGLRIIEACMKKNKYTDQQLADEQDYDGLLSLAKYIPR